MADRTHIEWTDATWNPITGCSVVSAGCKHCYAMKLAGTRLAQHPSRAGLTQATAAGPVWTGEVRFNENWLDQPLRWAKSRKIFVCAHSDLFHEAVPDEWIDKVFAVMALATQHTFQVLTKRPERMHAYITTALRANRIAELLHVVAPKRGVWVWPGEGVAPRNVWLGTSVENQAAADARIPWLLRTPAHVRWLSAEPLLGPVDLSEWLYPFQPCKGCPCPDPQVSRAGFEACCKEPELLSSGLHWVVAGGEAGAGARPMHPDWARWLRDQCVAADVPFLFKQWGNWRAIYDRDQDDPDWRRCAEQERSHPGGRWLNLAGGHGFHGERVVYVANVGKGISGRTLDGRIHDAYPLHTSLTPESP